MGAGANAEAPGGAWKAKVITLFPEAFPGVLGLSLAGRGLERGLWSLETVNLRDFGRGRHKDVDARPAGGGPGLVIRPDVLGEAIEHAMSGAPREESWPVICMSPRGRPLSQDIARGLSEGKGAILICGRFEGVDERVLSHYKADEISMGDFVLSGGEIAAQALIDSAIRCIPGILGNQASIEEESFSEGLLEHPQYTKPAVWQGRRIPEVLLSGNHAKVAGWRRERSEEATRQRRPDLWKAYRARRGMDPERG